MNGTIRKRVIADNKRLFYQRDNIGIFQVNLVVESNSNSIKPIRINANDDYYKDIYIDDKLHKLKARSRWIKTLYGQYCKEIKKKIICQAKIQQYY